MIARKGRKESGLRQVAGLHDCMYEERESGTRIEWIERMGWIETDE